MLVKEMWFSGEILLNLARNFSAAFLLACFFEVPFPVSINALSLQGVFSEQFLLSGKGYIQEVSIHDELPMMNK